MAKNKKSDDVMAALCAKSAKQLVEMYRSQNAKVKKLQEQLRDAEDYLNILNTARYKRKQLLWVDHVPLDNAQWSKYSFCLQRFVGHYERNIAYYYRNEHDKKTWIVQLYNSDKTDTYVRNLASKKVALQYAIHWVMTGKLLQLSDNP
jgi:hypothetical protein